MLRFKEPLSQKFYAALEYTNIFVEEDNCKPREVELVESDHRHAVNFRINDETRKIDVVYYPKTKNLWSKHAAELQAVLMKYDVVVDENATATAWPPSLKEVLKTKTASEIQDIHNYLVERGLLSAQRKGAKRDSASLIKRMVTNDIKMRESRLIRLINTIAPQPVEAATASPKTASPKTASPKTASPAK